MTVIAACWRCGNYIHHDDDYVEERSFFTCESCTEHCTDCGELCDPTYPPGGEDPYCESCLSD